MYYNEVCWKLTSPLIRSMKRHHDHYVHIVQDIAGKSFFQITNNISYADMKLLKYFVIVIQNYHEGSDIVRKFNGSCCFTFNEEF